MMTPRDLNVTTVFSFRIDFHQNRMTVFSEFHRVQQREGEPSPEPLFRFTCCYGLVDILADFSFQMNVMKQLMFSFSCVLSIKKEAISPHTKLYF